MLSILGIVLFVGSLFTLIFWFYLAYDFGKQNNDSKLLALLAWFIWPIALYHLLFRYEGNLKKAMIITFAVTFGGFRFARSDYIQREKQKNVQARQLEQSKRTPASNP